MSKSGTESSRANDPKAEAIAAAVAALRRSEVIVLPTETLYGLGADALDVAAVDKVFQLKGRDADNPIPVLVADRVMLDLLVAEIPPLAGHLMAKFWPGPLTLVLPAQKNLPKPLVNSTGGVGVRISSQPIAAKLVAAFGRPLTATSANLSGQPPARTVEQAKKYFAGKIDVFVDGGELGSPTGSTIAEIRGDRVRIIREGDISREVLQKIAGREKILL